MKGCAAAAVLLIVGTLCPGAETRLDGSYLHNVGTNLVTPHMTFSLPAHGGPVRACFIVPWQLASREVAGLVQRLDLDVDVVTVRDSHSLSQQTKTQHAAQVAGTSREEKEAEILTALARPHDVIVLGNFSFTSLPESVQTEIEKQVRGGTGLLLTYRHKLGLRIEQELSAHPETADRDWIWKNIPIPELAYFRKRWKLPPPQDALGTYVLGAGRVAVIDYGEPAFGRLAGTNDGGCSLSAPTVFGFRLPTTYRYFLALPARALLWAADRVPLTRLELNSPIVCPQAPAEVRLNIVCSRRQNVELVMLVRDGYGRFVDRCERQVTLQPGPNDAVFSPSIQHHGTFFIDAWISTDGMTLDWGSASIRFGQPVIAALGSLKQTWCRPGSPIDGDVALARPLNEPEEHLEIWVKDSEDRVLQKEPVAADGVNGTFGLIVRATPSRAMRLECVALRNGELVDRMEGERWVVPAPRKERNRFSFILWGQDNSGILGYRAYRAYRRLGVDTILHWPRTDHGRLINAADMMGLVYSYRTNIHNDPKAYRHTYLPRRRKFPFEAWNNRDDGDAYLEDWSQLVAKTWHRGTHRAGSQLLGP